MYQLGSLELSAPKEFVREFIETGAANSLIQGKTTRRTENRKEKFTLTYLNLSQAEVDSILSIFNLGEVVAFTSTEDNLSISATNVLINVTDRQYVKSGGLYRQNLKLVLMEVN